MVKIRVGRNSYQKVCLPKEFNRQIFIDMSLNISEIMCVIHEDILRSVGGNQQAAKRVRRESIRLSNLMKEWRKASTTLHSKKE